MCALLISGDAGQLYTKAITCGYVHTPPPSPVKLRKKADLDKLRRELEEEKECRRALAEGSVPPYFESDVYYNLTSKQVLQLCRPFVISCNKLLVDYMGKPGKLRQRSSYVSESAHCKPEKCSMLIYLFFHQILPLKG